MIHIKINNQEVQAEPGMTIMEVADANGFRIPRLCYHAALNPIGCCRLCVVEVKPGPPRPVPACTTPVAENMEVTTHSERLDHYRRELLELLLVNHPLDCPICDKGGECELQDLTRELKIKEQPYQAVKLVPRYDDRSPLIERYPDRCVNCERCVRICRDWVGAAALYLDNRGYRTSVTAGAHVMDCEHCGSCVAVCPTGTLIDKTFKYKARAWELEKENAVCPYCGGGCRVILNTKKGELKRITSTVEDPVNGILLCSRGRFNLDILQHPQRLTQPLIRRNRVLQPATWEEAFTYVADRLQALIQEYGAEAVAGIGSPRASNEANYVFQKFCRLAIGTPHIDSTASLDHQEILRAFVYVLGAPRVTFGRKKSGQTSKIQEISGFQLAIGALDDLRNADMVLVLAADVKKEMPPYAWQINQGQLKKRLKKLVIVDSRRTRFRSATKWNYYIRPGSSGFVLVGILKALLNGTFQNGKTFSEFRGKENLAEHLAGIGWSELESLTHLQPSEFHSIAQSLEEAERPSLIIGQDLAGQTDGYNAAQYVADLLLMFGKKLKVHLIAEKANTQGCSDMGVAPDWLPGYLPVSKAENLETLWRKRPPQNPGMSLQDIIRSAADPENHSIKALIVAGSDLLAVLPDRQRTERALQNLDFLVCQEVFLNETAKLADAVFPALTSVETPGTLTNTELRVRLQPGTRFCEGPKADWVIIQELSNRMGYRMDYSSAADIFSEIRQVFPHYDQYALEDIPDEGFFWHRLYLSKLGSASWKRKFEPALVAAHPELSPPPAPNDRYPFLLHLGKSLFHSGTLSRYGQAATLLEKEGRIRINPKDAQRLQLEDEDFVTVTSEKGSLTARVRLDRRVQAGMVQATIHFSDLRIQILSDDGLLTPVRLEKAT